MCAVTESISRRGLWVLLRAYGGFKRTSTLQCFSPKRGSYFMRHLPHSYGGAVFAGTKAVGKSARYNLGSSQSSKVGMVLTSGFHTQARRFSSGVFFFLIDKRRTPVRVFSPLTQDVSL